MANIFPPSGYDELSDELDADILALTHDEAIGCIRSLVSGGWVSAAAITLTMRTQRSALSAAEGVAWCGNDD